MPCSEDEYLREYGLERRRHRERTGAPTPEEEAKTHAVREKENPTIFYIRLYQRNAIPDH
jgi:hypothetical protein